MIIILELREMACAATFKGYTVLKKLYVSDKQQGALLNIDEKLEETVHVSSDSIFIFYMYIHISFK